MRSSSELRRLRDLSDGCYSLQPPPQTWGFQLLPSNLCLYLAKQSPMGPEKVPGHGETGTQGRSWPRAQRFPATGVLREGIKGGASTVWAAPLFPSFKISLPTASVNHSLLVSHLADCFFPAHFSDSSLPPNF